MIVGAVEGAIVSNLGPSEQAASSCAVLSSTSQDSIFGLNQPSPGFEPASGSTPPPPPAPRPWWRHGCFPRALIALGVLVVLTGSCIDACTGSNRIRHVPAIHGRVVDMETGQPLAGVKITRWFERDMIVGPGGADSCRVPKSVRSVTTDANGRFELPSWFGITRGITAVKWDEFKPGWTAGWGDFLTSSPNGFDVARRNLTRWSVSAENRCDRSTVTTTFRLRRVDNPNTAEDHFWAMQILVRDRRLKEEPFVAEVQAYLHANEPSPAILEYITSVESRLGGHRDDRPCYKANLAFALQASREQICRQHPGWGGCDLKVLARRRAFLERECGRFRSDP